PATGQAGLPASQQAGLKGAKKKLAINGCKNGIHPFYCVIKFYIFFSRYTRIKKKFCLPH
ncbi:MAG: hypothetical protein WBO36_12410, partial [Saprospiraceae bacterium]